MSGNASSPPKLGFGVPSPVRHMEGEGGRLGTYAESFLLDASSPGHDGTAADSDVPLSISPPRFAEIDEENIFSVGKQTVAEMPEIFSDEARRRGMRNARRRSRLASKKRGAVARARVNGINNVNALTLIGEQVESLGGDGGRDGDGGRAAPSEGSNADDRAAITTGRLATKTRHGSRKESSRSSSSSNLNGGGGAHNASYNTNNNNSTIVGNTGMSRLQQHILYTIFISAAASVDSSSAAATPREASTSAATPANLSPTAIRRKSAPLLDLSDEAVVEVDRRQRDQAPTMDLHGLASVLEALIPSASAFSVNLHSGARRREVSERHARRVMEQIDSTGRGRLGLADFYRAFAPFVTREGERNDLMQTFAMAADNRALQVAVAEAAQQADASDQAHRDQLMHKEHRLDELQRALDAANTMIEADANERLTVEQETRDLRAEIARQRGLLEAAAAAAAAATNEDGGDPMATSANGAGSSAYSSARGSRSSDGSGVDGNNNDFARGQRASSPSKAALRKQVEAVARKSDSDLETLTGEVARMTRERDALRKQLIAANVEVEEGHSVMVTLQQQLEARDGDVARLMALVEELRRELLDAHEAAEQAEAEAAAKERLDGSSLSRRRNSFSLLPIEQELGTQIAGEPDDWLMDLEHAHEEEKRELRDRVLSEKFAGVSARANASAQALQHATEIARLHAALEAAQRNAENASNERDAWRATAEGAAANAEELEAWQRRYERERRTRAATEAARAAERGRLRKEVDGWKDRVAAAKTATSPSKAAGLATTAATSTSSLGGGGMLNISTVSSDSTTMGAAADPIVADVHSLRLQYEQLFAEASSARSEYRRLLAEKEEETHEKELLLRERIDLLSSRSELDSKLRSLVEAIGAAEDGQHAALIEANRANDEINRLQAILKATEQQLLMLQQRQQQQQQYSMTDGGSDTRALPFSGSSSSSGGSVPRSVAIKLRGSQTRWRATTTTALAALYHSCNVTASQISQTRAMRGYVASVQPRLSTTSIGPYNM